jgi:hypothetical protein
MTVEEYRGCDDTAALHQSWCASKVLRTTVSGEGFLHRKLWIVVRRQIEHATEKPKGASYDHLATMVFASHALEAYFNFVGERLAPDFWKDERKHFRATGFAGKVKKVLELCTIPEPDKNSRPYRTIWELKELRDLIAHAKIEKFFEAIDHSDDETPERYKTPLDLMVTPEKARVAADDVREFANMIHTAARRLVRDLWFGETAFEGVLRRASGRTTLAE